MKILFITPHLSTGGAPQYLLRKIQELNKDHEIYCIEYSNITGGVLIVQRSQIENLLGSRLITLGEDKKQLVEYIKQISPEVIHFEEMPEYFCDDAVAKAIYFQDRNYKIIETSHDSSFDHSKKLYFPDRFVFVSEYQRRLLSPLGIPADVVEYPIVYKNKTDRTQALISLGLDPSKTHFLNVGLFTSRKNQAEIIEYARNLIAENVQFHFVGNQADNFKWYWEPLMKNFPSNCKWWGEKKDVDVFYNAMDALLFTSKGTTNDKETNPLVIREAIGWNLPILMYNLPVYCGMYDYYKNAIWLSENFQDNLNLIKNKMINNKTVNFDDLFGVNFEANSNKITFSYKKEEPAFFKISIKDADSNVPIFWCQFQFQNYLSIWIVPIGVAFFNFDKEESFRGFKMELYDANDSFVASKEYFIKNSPKTKIEQLNVSNPFDCLFVNYNEMFVHNVYDKFLPKEMGVVIDVGANSGLFTKLCLNKGARKVISLEPNSLCISNIKSITSNSQNVEIVDKALSDKNGFLKFYAAKNNSTIGSVNRDHVVGIDQISDIDELNVPCITLDSLINEKNIDKVSLLKMDIEGAEYAVFNSVSPKAFAKIDSILVEFHDNVDKRVRSLTKILIDNGYEIADVMQQGSRNGQTSIADYENTVNGTIYAVKKVANFKMPNVKVVHLQTNANDEREQKSRASLEVLKKIGLKYVLHTNLQYSSLPPRHNCARPHEVSLEKVHADSLTPAHYGCYEAFKIAMLSEFDSSIDYLMICEGDCLIEVDEKKFSEVLAEVSQIMEKNQIDYFSFGDSNTLDLGIKQSNIVYKPENQNLCYVTNKIIGLQCILFSKRMREKILEYIRVEKWDAADIYLNEMSWRLGMKQAILNERITTQADGISFIDKEFKRFIKKQNY
jgi:FkbM family methyltransferase